MSRGQGTSDSFFDELAFRPDPFQVRAAKAIEAGMSVLVAAPTGAGKTLVAEFAAARALARDERLFYTTPIKALSNQKYRDFRLTYGDASVGLLTGDNSINAGAPLVVMTTEVLRNMIYEESRSLSGLTYVVLDEVHYLQDRYRGATWEEIIIELPGSVQLISLSATVSNLSEFGGWLKQTRGAIEVIEEIARPVPLHSLYAFEDRQSDRTRFMPVFNAESESGTLNPALIRALKPASRGGRGHWIRSPSRLDVIDELDYQDALPAIYFIFSRAACDAAARQCLRGGVRLTTEKEARQIRSMVEEGLAGISDADLDALGYETWLTLLESGIATHHAGLIPAFKEAVEELFVRALVKVVFATETLALGINMPARAVVVESLSKFNGRFHAVLTPGEYAQLSGRAGRRGIDSVGYCIVMHSRWVPFARVAEVAGSRSYELDSSFNPTYNMATNLIATRDRADAERMLASSFAQYRTNRSLANLRNDLDRKTALRAELREKLKAATKPARGEAWRERDRQMAKQIEKLKRRIDRREAGLAGKFSSILEVLEILGYVGGWSLTAKGQVLSRVYCERDLLVTEALDRGLESHLEIAELAGFASCFVYESRSSRNLGVSVPTIELEKALSGLRRTWREIAAVEEAHALEATPEPDAGFVGVAYRWACGEGLDTLLDEADSAGDFVRNAKQVADICRQLAVATGRDSFKEAAKAMNRGVVAHSGI
ncbi:MAG: RNA helicase [Acidobacteria bacterium]|nr:MAG: RNA helicase [Acidobacteriota bacterium]